MNSKNFFLKMELSQNYGTTLRKYLGFPLLSVNALSVPFFLAILVLVDTGMQSQVMHTTNELYWKFIARFSTEAFLAQNA